VNECPDKILEFDETTGEILEVKDSHKIATFTEDLHLLQQTMKARDEDEDFVTIKQSEDRFYFTVESSGSMDAEDIVRSSLKVLKNKLESIKTEVANLPT